MRKKVFFASTVFLVTMLFAMVGWAAVYYLSTSGSATPPYDTWKKAANNLSQVLSLSLSGENTICVAEGIYSGSENYIQLNDAKYDNLSIIGRGNKANIIFKSNAYCNCYINDAFVDNIIFKNITIKSEREGTGNTCYIVTGHNVQFIQCNLIGNGTSRVFYIDADADVSLYQCFVQYVSYVDSYACMFTVKGNASLDINYTMVYSPNGSPRYIIFHESTGSLHVNNSVLAKSNTYLINQKGSGNLTINNSILSGAGWYNHDVEVIHKTETAGSCDVNNTVVLPNTFFPDLFASEGVNLQNVIFDDPKFKLFNIGSFIIPRVDDIGNVAYATSLADILAEYGYKGTYFLTTNGVDTVANALRLLLQGGVMEIASHTYSHTNLTYNHALHFEYTGSDVNPTVELDSSRVIHLQTDGSDVLNIDTTQPNADTLGEIINNFSGISNWVITRSTTDGQKESSIRDECKAESLVEMAAIAAPCDIDFLKETDCEDGSCEGFYKTEIYESRIDLTNAINSEGSITDPQTGQIYEARTFVPPYAAGDENVLEALKTSGYIGAGGISYFAEEALPYNVFKISAIPIENLIVDNDEEQTTKNAKLFAINTAISGLAVTVLSHNETEATLEEWRWVLNGFKQAQKYYKIQVTSLQLAVEALKKLGTYDSSTGDVDIHWSMPSFRLRHDSPCRDGGILNAGDPYSEVVYDLDGRRVTQPDGTEYYLNSQPIGCYLYRREFESRYVNGIDYKKMNRILEGCSGDGNDDVKIVNGLRY